jgi:hypothetical protein
LREIERERKVSRREIERDRKRGERNNNGKREREGKRKMKTLCEGRQRTKIGERENGRERE